MGGLFMPQLQGQILDESAKITTLQMREKPSLFLRMAVSASLVKRYVACKQHMKVE